MIILHENLLPESRHISKKLKKTFGFESKVIHRNLSKAFIKIPEFNGYMQSSGIDDIVKEYDGKRIMFLTPRDLYGDNKSINDWLFGFCYIGEYSVISTSRLKGKDNAPRKDFTISKNHYMKRLELIAIHEVGHDLINPNAKHYRSAKWVNADGHEQDLGFHCTDNKCIMYESVDITAPPKDEGYMRLGNMKKYDTGFDEMLKRVRKDWFCKKCSDSIKIDESYFR